MSEFNDLFDNSVMPSVLKVNRSLSKVECEHIYNYFKKYKPQVMFEFGVQNGCSTRAFMEIAKWCGYKLSLHSWDIVDELKCIDKKHFNFHLEDITDREEIKFDKYTPDLVYLDAHPYKLTRNIMEICLKRKINFMCHDVDFRIGLERSCQRTKGFSDLSVKTNANWELYLLGVLISTKLWREDSYKDDNVKVQCIRDYCGLGIVKHRG